MPTPAALSIELSATGDTPKAGAMVEYTITIRNDDIIPAYNLAVWDSLPSNLEFRSMIVGPQPSVSGSFYHWDLGSGVIQPGEVRIIKFTAMITSTPGGLPIANTVSMDYNDQCYKEPDRHPEVTSKTSFYPGNIPIVYPNPYNRETANGNMLKVTNVVPGSMISIFTVSGDHVSSMKAGDITVYWDGKNRYGSISSPGIYYWVVKTPDNRVYKGKLFIVGQ
jgi:uncharacterized repeat protein (TIGR01451 family)